MAKQAGPLFFTGTIDGLIFYKMGDQYYTRSKGSYKSAKHMRRNPKYQRTMANADRFSDAAKLVREVYYRHLPKALRKQGLFGKLTGVMNNWLYEGKSSEDAKQALIHYCQRLVAESTPAPARNAAAPKDKPHATPACKPSATKQVAAKQPTPVKQARYLSHWKVKQNGRLHVPHATTSDHPPLIPLPALSEKKITFQRENRT